MTSVAQPFHQDRSNFNQTINRVMRTVSGPLMATTLPWLPVLCNLAPPDTREGKQYSTCFKDNFFSQSAHFPYGNYLKFNKPHCSHCLSYLKRDSKPKQTENTMGYSWRAKYVVDHWSNLRTWWYERSSPGTIFVKSFPYRCCKLKWSQVAELACNWEAEIQWII